MKTEHFQNPDEFFRGTDFWMMNGELTEEGIEKQLREMKEKGGKVIISSDSHSKENIAFLFDKYISLIN